MTSVELFIGGFALLTYKGWQLAITGYWRLPRMFFPEWDIFGEAHYQHLDQIKQRLFSTWTVPIVVTAVVLWFTPWRSWGAIDPHALLRPVSLTASGIVTWRAISMDLSAFQLLVAVLSGIVFWQYMTVRSRKKEIMNSAGL